MSAGSSGLGAPSPRAAGDPLDMRRSVTAGGGAAPGYDLSKATAAPRPSTPGASMAGTAMSDMAFAFESAAQNGLQTPGLSGRPPFVGGAGMNVPGSSAGGASYPYPYATTPGVPASGPGGSSMTGILNAAPSPLSSAYRGGHVSTPMGTSNGPSLDPVTSTWLGTDDLLDSYMQSILPIFNDFDHATNNSMANGIGGGGGVGVPLSEVGR